ncbi:scarecrow-like protein 13 [Primulina eburnea]|uniref:scarecrow-like protein 13 n=1 Tax=Primulina eburnea TaxID=1245227 RepID=UPI003C6C915F
MQTSQDVKTPSRMDEFYHHQPVRHIDTENFFTLESTPVTNYAIIYNSPSAVSGSSNMSPFSPQLSNSHFFDLHCSSPFSGSSGVDDENKLMQAMWVLRNELGIESDIEDSGSFNGVSSHPSFFTRYDRILEMAPQMDLKQLLISCAETVSETDTASLSDRSVAISAAEALMDTLEKKVSVSGEPLQRLGAYMLEGIRARLLSSGSIIYKKLKCEEPTSFELMSYMSVLYQICPYWKFAYTSANVTIKEAMENEDRIHIIDFQIAQGSQWMGMIQSLSSRPGRPPYIRITGVDDSQSAHARGGGLELVGQRLAKLAESCGVPFEFHGAAMSGCEVHLENLDIRPGEALAVNFPYILHHMPDESVSTENHRDRLLRLVKSLSPKVVTIIEQESNTNTSTFIQRFRETVEYYMAMFESIDAAHTKDDRLRIRAEENCVARDVVNILACEGTDRVERHELFGKWSVRLDMAGFSPIPLSSSVNDAVREMLKDYSSNYRVADAYGALFLGWKNRAMSSSSAWR